jgi:hypothetical protein
LFSLTTYKGDGHHPKIMNKLFLILVATFSFVVSTAVKSQSVDVSLTEAYSAFDAATTYPQYLSATNRFKLIAKQNPQYWLANYYAALSLAIVSFQEPDNDNKDPMLDEADAFFMKIKSLDSTNDEVAVLGGLLAQARLSVAPESRHGKYGSMANIYFATAKKLNPDNPRIYYLQGNFLFYIPKVMGGGAEKALPLFQKAGELFADDPSCMLRDIDTPYWGKEINDYMIQQCKEKIGK